MKTNIVDAHYNEETGFSYCIIQNKYGTFMGTSQLHEEDKDIASSFRGCKYAETKAYIKYYKERIKIAKEDVKALTIAYTMIEQSKDCDIFSPEAKRMRKQIYIFRKEVEYWEGLVELTTDALLRQISIDSEEARKMLAQK